MSLHNFTVIVLPQEVSFLDILNFSTRVERKFYGRYYDRLSRRKGRRDRVMTPRRFTTVYGSVISQPTLRVDDGKENSDPRLLRSILNIVQTFTGFVSVREPLDTPLRSGSMPRECLGQGTSTKIPDILLLTPINGDFLCVVY